MKKTETSNSASKSQFGTMTATKDANNDYSSSTGATSSTGSPASKIAKKSSTNMANSTLTAKADANNDYTN